MADMLLELFCEEIPSHLQKRGGDELERQLLSLFEDADLPHGKIEVFTGPRRLTARVRDVALSSPSQREERRGPRPGAPEAAIQGFLKAVGLKSLEECTLREDKKGAYYLAVQERPGRPASEILQDELPPLLERFFWPVSMRWGEGKFRWIRPLRHIICLFDGIPVIFECADVQSGAITYGHRVMGPGPFEVKNFEDYEDTLLKEGFVCLRAEDRKTRIMNRARELCAERGLRLVEDHTLLEEVAGLAEWPVVMPGNFDSSFLELPDEVLRTAMRTHQKYFSVFEEKKDKLAPHFIMVANLEASDGGTAILKGNERVLAARLEDARYFWEQDLKTPLKDQTENLKGMVYHEKLGSLYEKAQRMKELAGRLAPHLGLDPEKGRQAAFLAKADLVTSMVGEFPSLQGVMGYAYAQAQGMPRDLAEALRDHYKPEGPTDSPPQTSLSKLVALTDKLDTLTGFWSVGEIPTSSKDPYALRRSALGVLRIFLEGRIRIPVSQFLKEAGSLHPDFEAKKQENLENFLRDRLKIHFKGQGMRHDLVEAVFALQDDDIIRLDRRLCTLKNFLQQPEALALLQSYKRATNIVEAEEKKDKTTYQGTPDPQLFETEEERNLALSLKQAGRDCLKAVGEEKYERALETLQTLRFPLDAFFEAVMVNTPDKNLRLNRLYLLSTMSSIFYPVADFSKIESVS